MDAHPAHLNHAKGEPADSGARLPSTAPALLERTEEIAAIDCLLDASLDGQGGLLLVDGEAGAGKSSLLGVASHSARERGMLVLAARGGEHEREFAYGVIRQLFEPELGRRHDPAELLNGAAALAAPVFDLAPGQDRAERLAIQHGLYWLAADLTAGQALALIVDDAQWADLPSLEALLYIARRLEGLPLALVVAVRGGKPNASETLLDELGAEPGARSIAPMPLSSHAVGELCDRELGTDGSERFRDACLRASGGNPFLLTELLHAAEAEAIAPTDANADRVGKLASPGVSRSILLRLAHLGADAVEVAQAIAILEPNAELEHVATLSNLSTEQTAAHCDGLIRARLLANARPLSFLHPLIRQAVYAAISAPQRAILHTEAARLLSASDTPIDPVAGHLLHAPPTGKEWVVALLRTAAAEARARGAPEAATEYLERALREPPPEASLLELRAELGTALLEAADDRGIDELLAVRAASNDPARRAQLSTVLATSLAMRGRVQDAASLLEESIAELGPGERDLQMHLRGQHYVSATWTGHPISHDQLLRDIEGVKGETLGDRHLLGIAALLLGAGVGREEEAVSIANRTVADPDALVEDALTGWLRINSMLALALADQTERSLELLGPQVEAARRRGAPTSLSLAMSFRAMVLWMIGDLADAEVDAGVALRLIHGTGVRSTWYIDAATAVVVGVERGDLDGVTELLANRVFEGEMGEGLPECALLCARGALRNASGRHDEARRDFLAVGGRLEGFAYANAELLGWRPGLALTESALGNLEQAERLAAEAVDVARAAGSRRGIGVTLRVHGVVSRSDGVELLREAVEVLAGTTARLHHARALVDLGGSLRRANDRRAAREPLREGLELAHRCGARPLEERARVELAAAGARPRKEVRSGVEALTPSELRVAKRAASGKTNREIAQELFVSVKTVEFHLRHCYQKLDIQRRNELEVALG
jgi:DNA-binding CsgD family transcriptional regulator